VKIDELNSFREKVLYPCVRVRTQKAGGSGEVIHSSDKNGTFVLTCHHVVEDAIEVKEAWSTLLQRNVKKDIFTPVQVEFFNYDYDDRASGSQAVEARIICYEKTEDIALLRLDGRPKGDIHVAAMFSCDGVEDESVSEKVDYGAETITVGAALGEDPIFTTGNLCGFNKIIDNKEYWLNTAPSIFGNSGGASFLADGWEFIGMPARISVTGGFASDAITHMGYIVPITRIMDFLKENMMDFLYDDSVTYKECQERIKAKREMAERALAAEMLRSDK